MKVRNINVVYFSATYTTRKIAVRIGIQMPGEYKEYDITPDSELCEMEMSADDLLVVAMPVYAGRLPQKAAEKLKQLKGNNTPAIALCVYGNRHYDDALLELSDIISDRGFKVVSAAVFVAQHSIFSNIAVDRPDDIDMQKVDDFAMKSLELIDSISNVQMLSTPDIPGNRPYKQNVPIPIYPVTDAQKCTKCGLCARLCPVHAIDVDNGCATDVNRCISCGRCIVACKQYGRKFSGELYKKIEEKFLIELSARKEPEFFMSE